MAAIRRATGADFLELARKQGTRADVMSNVFISTESMNYRIQIFAFENGRVSCDYRSPISNVAFHLHGLMLSPFELTCNLNKTFVGITDHVHDDMISVYGHPLSKQTNNPPRPALLKLCFRYNEYSHVRND